MAFTESKTLSTLTIHIIDSNGNIDSNKNATIDNNTDTWSFQPDNDLDEGVAISYTVVDSAGNETASSFDNSLTIDTTAPTLADISSNIADGAYKVNQVIPIFVNLVKLLMLQEPPQ